MKLFLFISLMLNTALLLANPTDSTTANNTRDYREEQFETEVSACFAEFAAKFHSLSGQRQDEMRDTIVRLMGEPNVSPSQTVARLGTASLGYKTSMDHPDFDPNYLDSTGRSALHWAVIHGDINAVKKLMTHPKTEINLNAKNNSAFSALHFAVEKNHVDIVELLLTDKDIDVESLDINNQTPLFHAAWNNSLNIVEILFKDGRVEDPNSPDKAGWTALHGLIGQNNIEGVKMFLNDPMVKHFNSKGHRGVSLLHYSVKQGYEMVTLLLSDDRIVGQLNMPNKKFEAKTPLGEAVSGMFFGYDHSGSARALLEHENINPTLVNLERINREKEFDFRPSDSTRKHVELEAQARKMMADAVSRYSLNN